MSVIPQRALCQGIIGEKGTRSEPATIPVAVCIPGRFMTKVGHWETEKANLSIAYTSQKTCFDAFSVK